MNFVADENISPKLAQILSLYDVHNQVTPITNDFAAGTEDSVWLAGIAAWDPKPTILSGDGRILRNDVERRLLRDAQTHFVYLAPGWGELGWFDIGWRMLRVWTTIVDHAHRASRPMVIEVDWRVSRVRPWPVPQH